MQNLFNTIQVGSQIELFKIAEQGLKDALTGKSDQFFYNIDIYLSKAPTAKSDMVNKGRAKLIDLALHWKKNEDTIKYIVSELDEDYLAIFNALEQYVHVGIDMESTGYQTALYTRNFDILQELYQQGLLEGDLDKLNASLSGTKTEKSVKDANFVTVRLDVVGHKDGMPTFKAVIPKSNLQIGGGKQFVFIPVPFFHMFDEMLHSTFGHNPFKFTKSSVVGQISYNVAIKEDIVRQAYAGCDGNLVESKLRKAKVGYDVAKQRYFAYDLEASLNSLGIASFRPEMLDKLSNIFYEDIDKSRHNVNFHFLRGIFKTKIHSLNKTQLEALNFIDISSYANMKDQVEAIILASERKKDVELHSFMKNNPEIFGDLEKALASRERMSPKILKELRSITLPVNEIERKMALENMLYKGIIKFTGTTKSGSIIERTGTNNPVILERMLGKDYVKQYESIRNKLKYVKLMLENGTIKNKLLLEKVGVEYNLLDHVDPMLFFADAIKQGDVGDALQAVNEALTALQGKIGTRSINESALLYRNVYANEPKEFFGSINVNNIISVDFAEAK